MLRFFILMSGMSPSIPTADGRRESVGSAVLVINSGSSSLKFSLIDGNREEVLVQGLAEALGSADAVLHVARPDQAKETRAIPGAHHSQAMAAVLEVIEEFHIAAVGHRVVHGGEAFSESVLIERETLAAIRACVPLAPLHNPANLAGIEAAMERFPTLPHVAVFDTAFHQTMPPQAFHYALPHALYENHRVRRYGFHGTSHRFVSAEAARLLDRDLAGLQLITAHLGNGCSACAVKNGQSVDTTMGFTPLEGLVMGTRSGDIDPNLHEFLANTLGKSLGEITAMLNRESGLLGISGLSNDMRTLAAAAEAGHVRAGLAIDVFCYRLAKGLLGLAAGLDRIDALVFTGGIGEHSAAVRAKTLSQLQILHPALDAEHNRNHGRDSNGRITASTSGLLALVVPTNEELVIAREAMRFLAPTSTPPSS
jgi:acetate kinase